MMAVANFGMGAIALGGLLCAIGEALRAHRSRPRDHFDLLRKYSR